jgi:penicillin-binding protein 1A
VTNVLQGVISSGTGTAAQLGRPAAGKTGTASGYTNAWFVGYTPTLSAAVWMGNAQSQAASIGCVKGVCQVFGGTWPALTWRAFMSQALAGVPATPFTQPAPITPPKQAAALAAGATTTIPSVEPGPPGAVQPTPVGGPYQIPAPVPFAPLPATTTTLPPPTTSTTSSTLPPSPGQTTTTTLFGGNLG